MINRGKKSSDPPRDVEFGRKLGSPLIAEMVVLLSANSDHGIRPDTDCGASRENRQTAEILENLIWK
ncbi:MAG: hypothetical protein DMG88_07225 [Acidobacteria bacterium]|nr:MAG: hypothetical protein DMG88_07225 [Acidobacteriota bacterium]